MSHEKMNRGPEDGGEDAENDILKLAAVFRLFFRNTR